MKAKETSMTPDPQLDAALDELAFNAFLLGQEEQLLFDPKEISKGKIRPETLVIIQQQVAEAKARLTAIVAAARQDEGGKWLDMVVRNDRSRLDSNEWYKLDPRDVCKFFAGRMRVWSSQQKGKDDE